MAHFAEIDETNTVTRVLVVPDDVTTIDGVEDEQRGIDFLNDLFPDSGAWVQTSYNHNIRTRYAGIGYTYDESLDSFIPPQPFPSWTLNAATADWQPPTPMPDDGPLYEWDEPTTSWVEITE
mgnify:CR=1 FL=1|jgi:hypothetical protein